MFHELIIRANPFPQVAWLTKDLEVAYLILASLLYGHYMIDLKPLLGATFDAGEIVLVQHLLRYRLAKYPATLPAAEPLQ